MVYLNNSHGLSTISCHTEWVLISMFKCTDRIRLPNVHTMYRILFVLHVGNEKFFFVSSFARCREYLAGKEITPMGDQGERRTH